MRFLLVVLLLSACGGPSPAFRGVPPTRVTVDGSVFDVRVDGNRAEAVRRNSEYAPRMGPIGVKAAFAIEAVSNCKVTRIDGDQAMIVARLSCGKGTVQDSPLLSGFTCEMEDLEIGQRGGSAQLHCRAAPG